MEFLKLISLLLFTCEITFTFRAEPASARPRTTLFSRSVPFMWSNDNQMNQMIETFF